MKIPVAISMSALILVGCAQKERKESAYTGVGGPITASQTGRSASYLSDQEQTFLKQAAQGGMVEVQMGRLGAQKGQSEAVRKLGQKLVQDHSKANQELNLLAAQKSVTLSTDIPIENESMLSHLSTLEGAEFDQAFKKHAVESHQQAIQKFQAASQQAVDSDVRAFAQKTLPVLQQHLKMAQDLPAGEQTGIQAAPGTSIIESGKTP